MNWAVQDEKWFIFDSVFKETHTVYFSSSLYIINQKPMIPRIHFHCMTTWVARSSGWNSEIHLLILWFRFTSQMELLSNINFYFDCKSRLCPPGKRKYIFAQESFYLQGILDDTNEQAHLSLTVNTNTWWKAELHLTNSESCSVCLPIEFHGFTSRFISKGYHSFVPGLISIEGMGPFKFETC